ncbi:MAG: WYL domain-containing protein [Vulcanimicrobiaceae bacterium]
MSAAKGSSSQDGEAADFGAAGRARDWAEPTESVERKIWLLLQLLRNKFVLFSRYERKYQRDFRSFQRDLQQLRTIGDAAGFSISSIRKKERVDLLKFERLRALDGGPQVLGLLGALVLALGEPIAHEFRALAAEIPGGDPFVRFLLPQLVEQSAVAKAYELLKEAWAATPRPAVVRFQYPEKGTVGGALREVEPYRVVIRSGSCYLVGYDLTRKGWRTFALDRFLSLPQRAGTIQKVRTIPRAYDSDDVVGFIKGEGAATTVTVELTPRVAASATSRRWQGSQKVEMLADGFARITFTVSDPAEVIRWVLGFGPDAKVVGPPKVVALARSMVEQIARSYAVDV